MMALTCSERRALIQGQGPARVIPHSTICEISRLNLGNSSIKSPGLQDIPDTRHPSQSHCLAFVLFPPSSLNCSKRTHLDLATRRNQTGSNDHVDPNYSRYSSANMWNATENLANPSIKSPTPPDIPYLRHPPPAIPCPASPQKFCLIHSPVFPFLRSLVLFNPLSCPPSTVLSSSIPIPPLISQMVIFSHQIPCIAES